MLKALLNFPKMVGQMAFSLVLFTLTEQETFLLAVASVIYGFLLSPLWGVAIYLTVYFFMRMAGGYVSMIARAIAQRMVRRENV